MAVAMLRQLRPLSRATPTAYARNRGLMATMIACMSAAASGVKVSSHGVGSNGVAELVMSISPILPRCDHTGVIATYRLPLAWAPDRMLLIGWRPVSAGVVGGASVSPGGP